MKNYFFLLLSLTIHSGFVYGQWCDQYYMYFSFENNICLEHLTIDTIANSSNVWQIGEPQKTTFNSAYSLQNVIVTDTTDSYPPNDTSCFYIKDTQKFGFTWGNVVSFSGYYQVNSDSLNDYGLIEFSPDNGTTWIDLINDTVYNSYYTWWSSKPTLTGNSSGWESFSVNHAGLGAVFNIDESDTVLYKFSFISDSIPDTLDGLMYDNLEFFDDYIGIEELESIGISSKAFPNPVNQTLTIEFDSPKFSSFELTIYNNTGRMVIDQLNIKKDEAVIDVGLLPSGLYYYLLKNSSEKLWSKGKFVKE